MGGKIVFWWASTGHAGSGQPATALAGALPDDAGALAAARGVALVDAVSPGSGGLLAATTHRSHRRGTHVDGDAALADKEAGGNARLLAVMGGTLASAGLPPRYPNGRSVRAAALAHFRF